MCPPPGFQTNQGQETDLRAMMQQMLLGQANGQLETTKKLAELTQRLDSSYHDLHLKFNTLQSKMMTIESQMKGKAIEQTTEFANAINLRSGRQLPERIGILPLTEDSDIQDGEEFQQETTQTEKQVESEQPLDQPLEPSHDRVPDRAGSRVPTQEKLDPAATKEKEVWFIPPPYKPPLPFPGIFKKQMVEKYKALFDKQVREIEVRMPLIDAFALIPPYQKFLKDAVMERIKEVQGMVVLSHECSAIIQKQVNPQKLRDPGSFRLPCSIGPLTFNRCLCDLGAPISLMPLSVPKRLGFTRYKPCNISLILADRSVRFPHGVLEDLPVRVGTVEVSIDFAVLEMDEEPKDPLILERPFLATTGAIIDVRKGKIDLNLGEDFKITFDVLETMKKPTIGGQIF
ncbi:PREDICTED: uncharacterized protein LOC104720573 [Camelina sativa]|uniref:Uncharacterized protein LOC104720573 n=1 Tax=Camelina sativa TaxID=90675 RepID=A0ABM0U6Q2_CAMSA|nr:PREDICTED: uncharacterized protein LOC104720573 [Camelina sativa]